MSQLSTSDAEYAGNRKWTWRGAFLAEMDKMVPWAASRQQCVRRWSACMTAYGMH